MSIVKKISFTIQQARIIYGLGEHNITYKLKSDLIDTFGYKNLVFNPNPGDVLTNGEVIIFFSKFSTSYFSGKGVGVLSTFCYDINKDILIRNDDLDIKDNIVGFKDEFIYADEKQEKLFYSKFKNLI